MTLINQYVGRLAPYDIKSLRLIIGVVLAVAIAFGFNWPFAFIMPVFVAKFLSNNKPKIPFNKLVSLFLIVVIAIVLGSVLTRMLLPFPAVFVLIITLLIFWISYWNNSGGNELVITMLLVGLTAMPVLGVIDLRLAQVFTYGFLFSCFMSLLLTLIMHELIHDKPEPSVHEQISSGTPLNDEGEPLPSQATAIKLALISTLMIMPVVGFFLATENTSILVLVFVALLAQKPDLVAGIKGSKALLLGNTIGGIIAVLMYNFLQIAPNFTFLLLLFAFSTAVLSKLIFTDKPAAALYAMALGTVIILVASASSGAADADEKFYARIIQIGCACGYIVFATVLANPLLKKLSQY